MQISAISNQGFTGRRTNIDNVIAQDDSVLREVAVNAALQHSDDKKHKKINNALWYSVPIVAGLAAGILNKGQSTLFHKTITGTAAKLASGLKHAAGWGIALGAADAIVGGKNLLTKHSEEAREFEKKHPFAMFAGLLGTGLAVLAVLPKGISKLYSKISPKVIGNLAAKTGKIADSINNNNFVKKANKFFGNIQQAAAAAPAHHDVGHQDAAYLPPDESGIPPGIFPQGVVAHRCPAGYFLHVHDGQWVS